jgi:hypothetical protein
MAARTSSTRNALFMMVDLLELVGAVGAKAHDVMNPDLVVGDAGAGLVSGKLEDRRAHV